MRYVDKDGLPIALEYWATLLDDAEYRVVGLWEHDDLRVSTVWLGIDCGLYSPIFETMVFSKAGEVISGRYRTLEEAQRGHIETVHAITGLITEVDECNK